jgi:hypothetical protein
MSGKANVTPAPLPFQMPSQPKNPAESQNSLDDSPLSPQGESSTVVPPPVPPVPAKAKKGDKAPFKSVSTCSTSSIHYFPIVQLYQPSPGETDFIVLSEDHNPHLSQRATTSLPHSVRHITTTKNILSHMSTFW